MGFTQKFVDALIDSIGHSPGPFWVCLGDDVPATELVLLDRNDFARITVDGPLTVRFFWLYDRKLRELGCFRMQGTEVFMTAGGQMSMTVTVSVGDQVVSPQRLYDPEDIVWDPSSTGDQERAVLAARAARTAARSSQKPSVVVRGGSGLPRAIEAAGKEHSDS